MVYIVAVIAFIWSLNCLVLIERKTRNGRPRWSPRFRKQSLRRVLIEIVVMAVCGVALARWLLLATSWLGVRLTESYAFLMRQNATMATWLDAHLGYIVGFPLALLVLVVVYLSIDRLAAVTDGKCAADHDLADALLTRSRDMTTLDPGND